MKENPEKLTRREEELMRCFWEHGPLFVRELVALSPDPKPHFNTLSTMVRALEAKGYVAHNSFGSTYQYYPVVSEEEFSRQTLGSVLGVQVVKIVLVVAPELFALGAIPAQLIQVANCIQAITDSLAHHGQLGTPMQVSG